ncbi:MAG: hypothetical protein ACLFRY_00885 [Spirochaetia bacterium]
MIKSLVSRPGRCSRRYVYLQIIGVVSKHRGMDSGESSSGPFWSKGAAYIIVFEAAL